MVDLAPWDFPNLVGLWWRRHTMKYWTRDTTTPRHLDLFPLVGTVWQVAAVHEIRDLTFSRLSARANFPQSHHNGAR